MHLDLRPLLATSLLCASFAVPLGCGGGDDPVPPLQAGSGGEGTIPDATPVSAKANVKFKTKRRFLNDVANALSLDQASLCKEVGTQTCADVHNIALGGTDAYQAGVYQPLKSSAVTTPIAVDRIALSACQTRAHRDVSNPEGAFIFRLTIQNGRLVDAQDPGVESAITELFRRIHLREPKEHEVGHLRQLYLDIEPVSANPARDWAALSCYAVLTMMESLFY